MHHSQFFDQQSGSWKKEIKMQSDSPSFKFDSTDESADESNEAPDSFFADLGYDFNPSHCRSYQVC